MYLIAIAWMYVVVMMTVVEATSPNGTVVGAIVTFFLYGALPLSIVLYILRSPGRKRARRLAEASADASATASANHAALDASSGQPDRRDHPPGDAVTAERKEP